MATEVGILDKESALSDGSSGDARSDQDLVHRAHATHPRDALPHDSHHADGVERRLSSRASGDQVEDQSREDDDHQADPERHAEDDVQHQCGDNERTTDEDQQPLAGHNPVILVHIYHGRKGLEGPRNDPPVDGQAGEPCRDQGSHAGPHVHVGRHDGPRFRIAREIGPHHEEDNATHEESDSHTQADQVPAAQDHRRAGDADLVAHHPEGGDTQHLREVPGTTGQEHVEDGTTTEERQNAWLDRIRRVEHGVDTGHDDPRGRPPEWILDDEELP